MSPSLTAPPHLSDERASFAFLRLTSGSLPPTASPAVPQAILWSPYAAASLPRSDGVPERCAGCGAVRSGGSVLCDFCGRGEEDDESDFLGSETKAVRGDTVEYSVRGAVEAGRGAVVVVLDEGIRGAKAGEFADAVRSVYRAARGGRFGLVSYGAGVSVAVLGGGARVVLDVLTAEGVRGMEIGRKEDLFAPGADDLFGEGGQEGGGRVVEMDEFLGRVLDVVLGGRAGDGMEDVVLGANEGGRAIEEDQVGEQRRLDAAVEVALGMLEGVVEMDASRIVCFVGGAPTLEKVVEPRDVTIVDLGDDGMANGRLPRRDSVVGLLEEVEGRRPPPPEPATWYDSLSTGFGLFGVEDSNRADGADLADDPLEPEDPEEPPPGMVRLLSRHEQQKLDRAKAAAHAELTSAFQKLGGIAGEARVPLHFVCLGDKMGVDAKLLHGAACRSKGGMVVAPPHGWPGKRSLAKTAAWLAAGLETRPGLVNVRVSAPYRVKRFVGPASPTAAPDTFTVAGADPGIGFVIVLENEDDVKTVKDIGSEETDAQEVDSDSPVEHPTSQKFAVVQLSSTSLGKTRVTTVRIPIAANAGQYWKTIDPEAASIVLGKLAIADAGGSASNAYKIAGHLDTAARRLLSINPPPVHIASMLFYMRRGPLVEAFDGIDEDASLALRLRFQASDSALSVLMAAPRAFTTSTGASEMVETSATTAVVDDEESALVLDAGATVFVWLGGSVSDSVERGVVASAIEVAENRGLTHVHVVRSGDENEVELLSPYLAPKSEKGDAQRGAQRTGLGDVKDMSFVEYVTILRKAMRAVDPKK